MIKGSPASILIIFLSSYPFTIFLNQSFLFFWFFSVVFVNTIITLHINESSNILYQFNTSAFHHLVELIETNKIVLDHCDIVIFGWVDGDLSLYTLFTKWSDCVKFITLANYDYYWFKAVIKISTEFDWY